MPTLPSLAAAILAVSLGLAASTAGADTPVSYTEGGSTLFTFDAPDFWTVHVGGPRDLADPRTRDTRPVNRVIGLQPATGQGVWVGFVSPPGVRTFSDARDYLAEIGPFLVKDSVVERRGERVIGGRAARTLAGHGRRNGRVVNFTAVAIDLPRDRMAIAVVMIEAGSPTDGIAGVNRMFASFRAER